jgi:hypothetical protein
MEGRSPQTRPAALPLLLSAGSRRPRYSNVGRTHDCATVEHAGLLTQRLDDTISRQQVNSYIDQFTVTEYTCITFPRIPPSEMDMEILFYIYTDVILSIGIFSFLVITHKTEKHDKDD